LTTHRPVLPDRRREPSPLYTLRNLITTSIDSPRHWGVIVVVALMFIFLPQLPPPNDWERNTVGLVRGLNIYQDPNSVYPPWGLVLLWPYYLMTAPGSRVASVLVMGWLAAQQHWTLLRFAAIVVSPFFIWTMVTSNVDVLALVLPLALWKSAEGKSWQWVGWSVSMVTLLLKPQGGIAMILYLVWRHRSAIEDLIIPVAAVILTIVPISLVGTPPLALQWMRNAIYSPSSENLRFWSINNVSLSDHLGLLPGVLIVATAMIGVYLFMRRTGKIWTRNHTESSIFLLPMLLGPYASNQGMIVPLALVISWPALLIQYALIFVFSYLNAFREYSAWFALLFGLSGLWLYGPSPHSHPNDSTTGSTTCDGHPRL
jgi:hypothetical protein